MANTNINRKVNECVKCGAAFNVKDISQRFLSRLSKEDATRRGGWTHRRMVLMGVPFVSFTARLRRSRVAYCNGEQGWGHYLFFQAVIKTGYPWSFDRGNKRVDNFKVYLGP